MRPRARPWILLEMDLFDKVRRLRTSWRRKENTEWRGIEEYEEKLQEGGSPSGPNARDAFICKIFLF